MEKVKAFCKRKNIEISVKRYLIDALGAMAQGLFASLLIGTIISTLGTQLNIPILETVGTYAKAAVGPAMAIAIGYALQAAPFGHTAGSCRTASAAGDSKRTPRPVPARPAPAGARARLGFPAFGPGWPHPNVLQSAASASPPFLLWVANIKQVATAAMQLYCNVFAPPRP